MTQFKHYFFPILLILCLFFGGVFGYFFPQEAKIIQPLGNLFLNFIFTVIVPLVFFSVASAIARMDSIQTLRKILFYMAMVFTLMGLIASILSLGLIKVFPLNHDYHLNIATAFKIHNEFSLGLITQMFSVDNFFLLFDHQHMLALIIFAILVGRASHFSQPFRDFLGAGEEVFMRVFTYIMFLAPIGFFAYFANLVVELGTSFIKDYFKISFLYYSFAVFYFFCIYSLWIYLFYGKNGLSSFWQKIYLPAVTALATCSSAASIPANISSCQALKISPMVYETSIPLGSLINKQGSIIGGIFKIGFLFSLYHLPFQGMLAYSLAILVSLLVGTVMGAIPSGGMLGELLILHIYGFPNSALVAIAAFSVIIDPIATLLNVCGNTVATMLIAKKVNSSVTS